MTLTLHLSAWMFPALVTLLGFLVFYFTRLREDDKCDGSWGYFPVWTLVTFVTWITATIISWLTYFITPLHS